MPDLQTTAALERVDGLTTAFLERDEIDCFIRQFPEGIAERVGQFTAASFQFGYMAGHRDGMNHADKTLARTVDKLLGGKESRAD